MFPDPIFLGPVSFNFYGVMVALGVAAGLALVGLTAPPRGLAAGRVRDLAFWLIVCGLLGARLFYVIFHWSEFSGQWWTILAYWRGGLMFQGGALTALLACLILARRFGLALVPLLDVLTPSLALGQALGRLGCFSVGCCYGKISSPDNPLALVFPPGSLAPMGLPLWPSQLMEAAGLFILTVLLVLAVRSSGGAFRRPGRVAALYLAGAGLLRLITEFFRGDFRGEAVIWSLPPTTLTAAAALLFGLFFLWRLRQPKSGF